MQKFLLIFLCLLLNPNLLDAEAKDYPIFDGQKYNGVYYPRVDIIEWGKPPHLEFHVYSKDEPIEIEAKAIERNGNRVLQVNYFFTKRKEKVCRSVIAPANFAPDTQLYLYKDPTDKEYDNIYVSVNPMQTTKNIQTYAAPTYTSTGCDENNSDSVGTSANSTASGGPSAAAGANTARDVASSGAGTPVPRTLTDDSEGSAGMTAGQRKAEPEKKHDLINYENNALPYNF